VGNVRRSGRAGSLGSSRSSRWISSLNGSNFEPANGRSYLGAADERNARRTVLRSRPVRRAISLIDSPNTKCIRRISAHCSTPTNDLLLTRPRSSQALKPHPDTTHHGPRGVKFNRRAGVSIQAAPTIAAAIHNSHAANNREGSEVRLQGLRTFAPDPPHEAHARTVTKAGEAAAPSLRWPPRRTSTGGDAPASYDGSNSAGTSGFFRADLERLVRTATMKRSVAHQVGTAAWFCVSTESPTKALYRRGACIALAVADRRPDLVRSAGRTSRRRSVSRRTRPSWSSSAASGRSSLARRRRRHAPVRGRGARPRSVGSCFPDRCGARRWATPRRLSTCARISTGRTSTSPRYPASTVESRSRAAARAQSGCGGSPSIVRRSCAAAGLRRQTDSPATSPRPLGPVRRRPWVLARPRSDEICMTLTKAVCRYSDVRGAPCLRTALAGVASQRQVSRFSRCLRLKRSQRGSVA
jgi:hypothetical protein